LDCGKVERDKHASGLKLGFVEGEQDETVGDRHVEGFIGGERGSAGGFSTSVGESVKDRCGEDGQCRE
jgi:hypothetical protein